MLLNPAPYLLYQLTSPTRRREAAHHLPTPAHPANVTIPYLEVARANHIFLRSE
jgi:hypothetical protein